MKISLRKAYRILNNVAGDFIVSLIIVVVLAVAVQLACGDDPTKYIWYAVKFAIVNHILMTIVRCCKLSYLDYRRRKKAEHELYRNS